MDIHTLKTISLNQLNYKGHHKRITAYYIIRKRLMKAFIEMREKMEREREKGRKEWERKMRMWCDVKEGTKTIFNDYKVINQSNCENYPLDIDNYIIIAPIICG